MNKQFLILTVTLALLLAALAGCTALPMQQPAGAMPGMDAMATEAPLPEPEPGKLTIVDVRARPAPLAGGTGAVYFTVLNGLDADVQLVSAASPAANVVETHETVAENGVMKMIPLPEGYPAPAGEALVLKPGGKHIMLIDVIEPLEPGDELELTVNFDNGEVIELTVPVLDMQMNMPANMQMPDQAGAMEGHDMQPAADATHEHGDMAEHAEEHQAEHAAMEHSDLMLAPEVKAAIKALPVMDLHAIDETLNEGGALDSVAALATIDAVLEQVRAVTWPMELEEMIGQIETKAGELRSAVESGDMSAAGPLAVELHDLLHGLEMHAGE
jgi:copper(I)-binding protein